MRHKTLNSRSDPKGGGAADFSQRWSYGQALTKSNLSLALFGPVISLHVCIDTRTHRGCSWIGHASVNTQESWWYSLWEVQKDEFIRTETISVCAILCADRWNRLISWLWKICNFHAKEICTNKISRSNFWYCLYLFIFLGAFFKDIISC